MQALKNKSGFSILELMVAFAVFAILGAASAPSLKTWLRTYRTKSAARDLYSNLQTAKVGSVKENRQWKVTFDAGGSYNIIKCLTVTCEAGTLNTDYEVVKAVTFSSDYNDAIKYYNPQSSTVFDTNPLTFSPNGLTNQGYVYISDRGNTKFYRIGLPSFAGSIRIQQWNGSSWH